MRKEITTIYKCLKVYKYHKTHKVQKKMAIFLSLNDSLTFLWLHYLIVSSYNNDCVMLLSVDRTEK